MESKLELTDPEHPQGKMAAEATARLLVNRHEREHASQPKRCEDVGNVKTSTAGSSPTMGDTKSQRRRPAADCTASSSPAGTVAVLTTA